MEDTPSIDATRLPACAATGAPVWSVADGRLANVYVHITSALTAGGPAPLAPVSVSQHGCAVHPRVVALRAGQPLLLDAADGTHHDVRITKGLQILFEGRLGPGTPSARWIAAREGFHTIRCEGHAEARGAVAVSAHPFFAVTGRDGAFVITGVPPGRHTLAAWHENGGEKTAEVQVSAGQVSEVRFQFVATPALAASPIEPSPAPVLAATTPPEPEPPVPAPPEPGLVPPSENLGFTACSIAVDGTSPVARACAEGGAERATLVMKQIVAAARDWGTRLRCQSCHQVRASYALLPHARGALAHLLTGAPVVSYIVPRLPSPRPTPQRRGWRAR